MYKSIQFNFELYNHDDKKSVASESRNELGVQLVEKTR